jgi:hypothetical protein
MLDPKDNLTLERNGRRGAARTKRPALASICPSSKEKKYHSRTNEKHWGSKCERCQCWSQNRRKKLAAELTLERENASMGGVKNRDSKSSEADDLPVENGKLVRANWENI